MCADSDDLKGDGRRNFIARGAAENPDAIIMTQRGFETIPLTREGHEAYLAYMKEMFQVQAEADTDSVKDQVTMLTEFEEKLRAYFDPDADPARDEDDDQEQRGRAKKKKAKRRIEQDPGLCWEQLGADYIVVDESQDFNNLWVPSAEPGMAIGFTHRAIDLEMKLHATRARYGNRVATFATGTAVTNKIPQFYVLLRLPGPGTAPEGRVRRLRAMGGDTHRAGAAAGDEGQRPVRPRHPHALDQRPAAACGPAPHLGLQGRRRCRRAPPRDPRRQAGAPRQPRPPGTVRLASHPARPVRGGEEGRQEKGEGRGHRGGRPRRRLPGRPGPAAGPAQPRRVAQPGQRPAEDRLRRR